jgi:uncharacterized Zn finger protein
MKKNWWVAVWNEKMERLAQGNRLAEGAAYISANKIQRCRLENRTIVAAMQGWGESPVTVRISFGAFTPEQWDQLFAAIRDPRSLASSLAAGDLPIEAQTAFAKAKLRFMPERGVDLQIQCGCADWLKPCKHLAAAWLQFGQDFERDPSLLFQLRGLGRDELFARLRGAGPDPARSAASEVDEPFEEEAVVLQPQPLPANPEDYWSVPPLPADSSGERRQSDEDIFEKLGPAPFSDWGAVEPQFHRVYDAVYEFASTLLAK